MYNVKRDQSDILNQLNIIKNKVSTNYFVDRVEYNNKFK